MCVEMMSHTHLLVIIIPTEVQYQSSDDYTIRYNCDVVDIVPSKSASIGELKREMGIARRLKLLMTGESFVERLVVKP